MFCFVAIVQVNSAKFLRDMNTKINEAKRLYEATDKEIGTLHKQIKSCEEEIIRTKKSIEEWNIRHLGRFPLANQSLFFAYLPPELTVFSLDFNLQTLRRF